MIPKKKILVVDDNYKWLETIEMILAPHYELSLFTDPLQAEKALARTDYDLVILDKNLLGVSGLHVLKQMRDIKADLRAIILTGYADVESAVESMKIGALDYLSKGTKDLSKTLKTKVEEALSLKSHQHGEEQIINLISQGENATLEFKSSARWDVRANKLNKELEKVIVKTIAAFMNSGHYSDLLIGVDDNGALLGLEQDFKTLGKRQDRDGYENFLMTLLLDAFGKDCAPFIKIIFHRIDDKDICQIKVLPSPKPVFVKDDKGEHLFIRTGNSTRLLSTREALEYCKIRWDL